MATVRSFLSKAAALWPAQITTTWPGIPLVNHDGTYSGSTINISEVLGMSPAALWRSQPHLRSVVDFLARNIAQLGIHSFVRASNDDRLRTTTDISAKVFARPNDHMTRYELIYALMGDLALYQSAYWMITEAGPNGFQITPIPAAWVVATKGGDIYSPDYYVVQPPIGSQVDVDAKTVERFHGWDPLSVSEGTSPVATLKATLLEQMHAQSYREQQWKRGGRVGAVISRPAGHRWGDEQEKRFMAAFKDAYSGDSAPEGGGVPILQDGMTMQRIGFSAKEDEYIEGTKLSLATVCAVYHVNPTMIGQLDNANYSNVREFRRMLYGDTLGPWLVQMEDRFNTFLLPRLGAGEDVYVEFNIAAKLAGSFEEQAAVKSTATGGPWLTRNEARAMENRPALPGGDELITPMNVTTGGQASPQDGGTPPGLAAAAAVLTALQGSKSAKELDPAVINALPLHVKADAAEGDPDRVTAVLKAFFEHQQKVVLSAIGGKADWWNDDKWNSELASDLLALALEITAEIGSNAAKSLGFDPEDYSAEQTQPFLIAVAEKRAEWINATTRAQLDAAIADNDNEDHTPAHVFDIAKTSRAASIGVTLATTLACFGTTEAAKQVAPGRATKTWMIRSTNPRKSHLDMNDKTVGIEDKFSNGSDWPGDPVLGADGVSGCKCIVKVVVP